MQTIPRTHFEDRLSAVGLEDLSICLHSESHRWEASKSDFMLTARNTFTQEFQDTTAGRSLLNVQ